MSAPTFETQVAREPSRAGAWRRDRQHQRGTVEHPRRVAVIGVGSGARIEVDLLSLMARRGRIGGSTLRARSRHDKAVGAHAVETHVVPLLAAGDLHVPVAATYPMAEAAAAYDLVVVDSAPLSPIADTQVLVRMVDAAILVVRSGVAPYPLARQSAALLEPKLLGVVLNGVERVTRRDYAYGYYAPHYQEEAGR